VVCDVRCDLVSPGSGHQKKNTKGEGKSKTKMAGEQIRDIREWGERRKKESRIRKA
jgi:hypothetical protein